MKRKAPKSIYILIATAATVILWIIFEVTRIIIVKPDPTVPGELLKPISPLIDTQTLDKINSKLFFEPGDIPETIIFPEVQKEQEAQVVDDTPEELTNIPESTKSAEATNSANEKI